MSRRKRDSGFRMNITACPTCPAYTPFRCIPGRDRVVIECMECGRELKSWEPPVIWVDGEPVSRAIQQVGQTV